MSFSNLTLGERMVMAARLMAAEHVRQEAEAAGVDIIEARQSMSVPQPELTIGAVIRHDLYRRPALNVALRDQPARPTTGKAA